MSTTDTDTTIPPENPSQYIRTYAKDVALLTGKDPKLAKAAPQFASPAPAPTYAHTTFTPPDESLIVPTAPLATPPSLTTLESDAERESILARLRAKVAASKMPEAATVSFPSIQAPAAAPTVLPPVSTYVPPLPLVEPPKVEVEAPAPFHSYSTDFSDRIDTQHASQFSVLAAEDANAWKAPAAKKKLNLLPIIAGVVLVVAGTGGVFAAYHFLSQAAPIATAPLVPSLIVPDQKVVLNGSAGSTLMNALANQASQSLPSGEVLLTYTTQATTTKQGVVETPESGGALITALNLPAPDIFIRNIDPSSMVGVVNAGTQTRAFFIFRVLSYERTFAGMLAWEPTMGSDLALLYPAYPAPPPVQIIQPVIATTTATTTKGSKSTVTPTSVVVTQPQTLPQLPPQFVDEVVDNHNARALKDSEGRTIMIYGYADPQTLILARDEAAFTLLIGRLQASQQ